MHLTCTQHGSRFAQCVFLPLLRVSIFLMYYPPCLLFFDGHFGPNSPTSTSTSLRPPSTSCLSCHRPEIAGASILQNERRGVCLCGGFCEQHIHHTRTTRTFFSSGTDAHSTWLKGLTAPVMSCSHKTVIVNCGCHVTLSHESSCVLFILHLSIFLYILFMVYLVTESNDSAATPLAGEFGRLASTTPHTGYEPKHGLN